MNVQEIVKKLQERNINNLSQDEVIELCFVVIRKHPKVIEQCRAAVILSGIIKSGLGKKTKKFLEENPKLPSRVHEILRAAVLRMESF